MVLNLEDIFKVYQGQKPELLKKIQGLNEGGCFKGYDKKTRSDYKDILKGFFKDKTVVEEKS